MKELSESTIEDIVRIVEEKVTSIKQGKKNQIAKEINRMMLSGETDKIKLLPNGEIMGDPETVKKLQDMKSQTKQLDEGSYITADGRKQFTLDLGVPNGLDGRNLKLENEQKAAEILAKREAKKNRVKNPNRVKGGKTAHATRIANQTKEFYSRPIFKTLGYNPNSN